MTPEQTVPVADADREAAANYLQSIDTEGHAYPAIRLGLCDHMGLIQAFARHRIAAKAASREEVGRLLVAFLAGCAADQMAGDA